MYGFLQKKRKEKYKCYTTLEFNGGKFTSGISYNNETSVTVNIPTDISHLTFSGNPTDWGTIDTRFVNATGDTMIGGLSISSGGIN